MSPPCRGDVLAETLTEGHCDGCGLHHRRGHGALNWDQIIGPVVVTLFGSAGAGRTAAGYQQLIEADAVTFEAFKEVLRIDGAGNATTFRASVPSARLVSIVACD